MKRFTLLLALALAFSPFARAAAAVTLSEDDALYTLDNGIVTARIAKASGDLVSLRFKDHEMLATFLKPDGTPDLEKDPPGHNVTGLNRGFTDHQYGFWSHDAMGPRPTANAVAKVTIDPKSNNGARAEVSVKGSSKGRWMGTGPGVPGGADTVGQFAADVEIRYALGRGDSGVFTYCEFDHPSDYPASGIGEARFCAKLADFFDWLSVADDPHHFKHYPKELREGDKYIYTVVQSENPAFGWSSTTAKLGFFILNASMEYMSGGPTKVEFEGHRDTNAIAAPCVLNYWRSSHYGGAEVNVGEGEHWKKVIGPFMMYVNSGPDPKAMFDDAKAQQKKQAAAWPYDWVKGVDYPSRADRTTVKGQFVLQDPQSKMKDFSRLTVGLVYGDYTSPRVVPPPQPQTAPKAGARVAPKGPPPIQAPRTVTWQTDAKHYEFWVRGDARGRFELKNVRPGKYALQAFTDGVLGEFVRADVVVEPGKPLDLGKLTWTPVRKGQQLWDVGIPNRDASEFAGGPRYWEPTIGLEYANLFPSDVNYIVGKSDFHKDWFFQHVPHNEDPKATPQPFNGLTGPGRATPYAVTFDVASAPKGKATLRLAICGGGARELSVTVNDQPAGKVERLVGDGTPARHGQHGIWYEREVSFDASLLKPGTNVLKLIIPAGPVNNGVMYDYVRLELDPNAATI